MRRAQPTKLSHQAARVSATLVIVQLFPQPQQAEREVISFACNFTYCPFLTSDTRLREVRNGDRLQASWHEARGGTCA